MESHPTPTSITEKINPQMMTLRGIYHVTFFFHRGFSLSYKSKNFGMHTSIYAKYFVEPMIVRCL